MEKVKVYEFCCQTNCPVVEDTGSEIVIGEKETGNGLGGFTKMSREQFRDLVQAIKKGELDSI